MIAYFLFGSFLGLFFGSFLNVIVDRGFRSESFLRGRSHADCCKRTLAWFELIPVFSFLFLEGKCRYCKKKLSWYYPFTEVLTGIVFFVMGMVLLPVVFQDPANSVLLLYYGILSSCLLIIFFADLKYGIIPDGANYTAIITTVLFIGVQAVQPISTTLPYSPFIQKPEDITNYILSAVGATVFFFLLFVITKGKGMGFGDVKLSFLLGLLLGFPKIIVALYVAFLTGAAVSIILILWRKKRLRGSTIPFGPFLIIGAVASLFFGEQLFQMLFYGFPR